MLGPQRMLEAAQIVAGDGGDVALQAEAGVGVGMAFTEQLAATAPAAPCRTAPISPARWRPAVALLDPRQFGLEEHRLGHQGGVKIERVGQLGGDRRQAGGETSRLLESADAGASSAWRRAISCEPSLPAPSSSMSSASERLRGLAAGDVGGAAGVEDQALRVVGAVDVGGAVHIGGAGPVPAPGSSLCRSAATFEHQVLEQVGETHVWRPTGSFLEPTWYQALSATTGVLCPRACKVRPLGRTKRW